jgi:tRNA-splicing ligase RtcB (3'-phosphate/5'-hydroxy nucleic acid ligase)
LSVKDVKDKLSKLLDRLYNDIPSGLGSKGDINISLKEEVKLLKKGAEWAVSRGMGVQQDLEFCEDGGAMQEAQPESVSQRALERGMFQVGTLGSGNHFLEVQVIQEIFEEDIAEKLGLEKGKVTLMIHSGSRGLGYQVCEDYSRLMVKSLPHTGIQIPDKQLACAFLNSKQAQDYIAAMGCAANYAWVNRQVLMHLMRRSFEKVFSSSWQSLGLELIYDIAHNIAKFEKHSVLGKEKTLCVHRKGATRALGPDNPLLPQEYKSTGQPVIIPGDMGTSSYLLVGRQEARETFSSACHGAGRIMSRKRAKAQGNLSELMREFDSRGIEVRAKGKKTLLEEAPWVYKDIDSVVDVVEKAGLSKKVCKMVPLGVVKG